MGRFSALLMLILSIPQMVPGQAIQTEFGKNRIQYTDDFEKWDMYETANFVTYWYGKGREIAHTVVQLAELDNTAIQRVLEHKMNDKIELIVYVDLSDMKQTNIGQEEQFVSKSGITKVVDNKILLYFDGDHNTLRQALREGIADVYIQSMLHGSNLQEVVQNAVLLNLPDWFQAGLVSYIGEDWSPALETEIKDYFAAPGKKRRDFARFARQDPRLAGHSMWDFIARTYGQTSISNILYLTRINRSLENGLFYVLGLDSRQLGQQWEDFYRAKFDEEVNATREVHHDLSLVSPKRRLMPARIAYSPGGRHIAYSTNDHGRTRLGLYALDTQKREILLRYGVRNYEQHADEQYPAFAWSPDGRFLSILSERRDVAWLTEYNVETGEQHRDKLSPEYQRIYTMAYWSPDTLLLNGTVDGIGDLFLYDPVTRQSVRMTNDFYDDLDATVATFGDRRTVVFASNRPDETLRPMALDSILPIGPFNLFALEWSGKKGALRQLTFAEGFCARDPRMAGPTMLVCRADVGGRWQRMRVSRLLDDPPETTLQTQYDRDILLQEYVPGAEQIIEVFTRFDRPVIQLTTPDSSPADVSPKAPIEKPFDSGELTPGGKPVLAPADTGQIDPRYLFQTPFPPPVDKAGRSISLPQDPTSHAPTNPSPTAKQPLAADKSEVTQGPAPQEKGRGDGAYSLVPFLSPRIIAARLRFKVDNFNLTFDNSLLFGGLDSYAGEKREFQPQPLGLLVKSSITDLLEDYRITGGVRFPTTFNGSEYFLVLDHRKRRIDRQYALYRKSVTETDPAGRNPLIRNQFVSVLGNARFTYPFDNFNSIRLSGTLRNDRTIALATDPGSLDQKTDDAQRIGLRAEWIFDNSRSLDVNVRTGTRVKTAAELVKRFDLNLFEAGTKFQFNKGFMTVLSLDARHYVSPDQRTVFAARLAAATTMGSERILYYLGGVENWLFAEYSQGSAVPPEIAFAYTTLAAQLRGFKYNARNGSSFALVNTEIRVPLFQYLSRQKIRSSILRNTQVVGFFDIGTAWHGANPFSPENPLNTVVLTNPPTVTVTVNYYRNPLVMGYGVGMRTLLFGYILKLDYAWGRETKSNNKPILHFSMGADF